MSYVRALTAFVPFTRHAYVGEDTPCMLCGDDACAGLARHDRGLKRLDTVICLGCGLLRTQPMPTEAELAAYYAAQYRLSYQFAWGGPPRVHLVRSARLAKRRVERLAAYVTPGARVLDVGAGSGEFLAACRAQGCTVQGLEPDASYAGHARDVHGLDVATAGWGADAAPGPYDLITSFHVFEHLRDPKAALLWLTGRLAEGGRIAIEVPDMSPDPRRKLFERLHFAHVHGFTPQTLAALGAACGLEPDPAHRGQGTAIVFRRALAVRHPPPCVRQPDCAAALAGAYDRGSVAGHVLRFGWAVDMARRVGRDLRDRRG